jgi:hypothetical protein
MVSTTKRPGRQAQPSILSAKQSKDAVKLHRHPLHSRRLRPSKEVRVLFMAGRVDMHAGNVECEGLDFALSSDDAQSHASAAGL